LLERLIFGRFAAHDREILHFSSPTPIATEDDIGVYFGLEDWGLPFVMGKPNFTMLVLSTSPDAAIRRLRGIAASLDGKAELISCADFNARGPQNVIATAIPTLLVVDGTSQSAPIHTLDLTNLDRTRCCIIKLTDQHQPETAQYNGLFCGANVSSLDHLVIRTAFASLMSNQGSMATPEPTALMRWGYAASLWRASLNTSTIEKATLASHPVAHLSRFAKQLHLPISAERNHLQLLDIVEGHVSDAAFIQSAIAACDGINVVTTTNIAEISPNEADALVQKLAAAHFASATLVVTRYAPEKRRLDLTLCRPVNGEVRLDGKPITATPPTFVVLHEPGSKEPAVRLDPLDEAG